MTTSKGSAAYCGLGIQIQCPRTGRTSEGEPAVASRIMSQGGSAREELFNCPCTIYPWGIYN